MIDRTYLQTDDIRADLKALEKELWETPIEKLPAAVRDEWEFLKDLDAHQAYMTIHDARFELVQEHVFSFEDALRKTKCKRCGNEFDYFLYKNPRKRPHEQPKSPDQPHCLPCCDLVDRDERERAFFKLHRSARYYLEDISEPPRPLQFTHVINWKFFNEDEENLPLLLVGSPGTGKTTGLFRLFYRLAVDECEDVIIINAVSLANQISEAARGKGEYDSVESYFEHLSTHYMFLGIDDLDKARFTPRVASEIYKLIEMWCRELQYPLFVTINSLAEDLQKLFPPQIGPAVIDRLRKHTKTVNFDVVTDPEASGLPVERISVESVSSEPEYDEDENEQQKAAAE